MDIMEIKNFERMNIYYEWIEPKSSTNETVYVYL